jgi:glycosyltransferase involved in cell wall biosynthesis
MDNKVLFNLKNTHEPNISHGGLRCSGIFKENKKDEPLITIITTVKNGEKYLEEALLSLRNQKYKNFEHIIVDANSSDKTLEIIKRNNNEIDYWVSLEDKGIWDGFNLGMKLARGKYLGFLNSDDKFTPEALLFLTKYIKNFPKKDFIFGAVKKHWGVLYGYKPWKINWSWGFYSSHSTGFFIKTSSAQKVGLYNLDYKYSSDYDYFFRMIVKEKMSGIGTNKEELFGYFRRGGFSSKTRFIDHFYEETKIRIDNNQNLLLVLFIFVFKYLKHLNKIRKQ